MSVIFCGLHQKGTVLYSSRDAGGAFQREKALAYSTLGTVKPCALRTVSEEPGSQQSFLVSSQTQERYSHRRMQRTLLD